MKVESRGPVSCWLSARASNSCLMRADFSCSSCVMRSLLSVTSWAGRRAGGHVGEGYSGCRFLHPSLHLTWVSSRFCSFSMSMVCCCQPGAEDEAGARVGPGGPEEDEGRACGKGMVGTGRYSSIRERSSPSWLWVLGCQGTWGHSPCKHRLQLAVPPGTGPPPGPWAAAVLASGGSPQPQSPGRKAGRCG